MTSNQRFLRGLIPSDGNKLTAPAEPTAQVKRRIAKNPDYLSKFRDRQALRFTNLTEKLRQRREAAAQAILDEQRIKALAEAERQANLKANEDAAKKKADRKARADKPLIVEVKS